MAGTLTFTRSRPYRKNDTAHVESRNWTHVRQHFGYERHDNPAVVVRTGSFQDLILVGFFAAVMWPVIFSLALNSVAEHHGSFSGILVTGIIGGAVVPLIVGGMGDLFGLRAGMLFLYLAMGYILSIAFWAKPLIRNVTIQLRKKEAE